VFSFLFRSLQYLVLLISESVSHSKHSLKKVPRFCQEFKLESVKVTDRTVRGIGDKASIERYAQTHVPKDVPQIQRAIT
jgi:hypothetical protein